LPLKLADVCRGDRRVERDVAPRGVVAEAAPVVIRGAAGRSGCRQREQQQSEERKPSHCAARSGVFCTHGPGGVSSDSACRYASPASGKSLQCSKQKYRRRQCGKNLRLKLCRRSTWKSRSALRSVQRTTRVQRRASGSARRKSAKTAKLSDSSVTACDRAHATVSVIRYSINPFGVSRRRRIDARE